jgi:2,3-bisphosphoglycerate-independent phosphoglycerate mutase
MFGFADVPFPGRAVLEGIGAGLELPNGVATTFASLRTSEVKEGVVWITGRAARDDMSDADLLLVELRKFFERDSVKLDLLGRGEALLQFNGHPRGGVTDSDPFFENIHPWMRVRATEPSAIALAGKMNSLLAGARQLLLDSDINQARVRANKPALDTLTTKWSGTREAIPSFVELAGVPGAAVTDARMYRGLAGILGLTQQHLAPGNDYAVDLAMRIEMANDMIAAGARFVHVHTKVTDEAGHTKDPWAKLKALEALDPGLAELESLADRAIVVVTGDHATPSVDGILHTGDPSPLILVGPTVRPDRVTEFGEMQTRDGWYGVVQASELLPLMFSHANRPMFLGHKAMPRQTIALSDRPEAMPLTLFPRSRI